MYVGYRLTETSPVLTIAYLKDTLADAPPAERERRQAMTGLPVVGIEMTIVDESGRELPWDKKNIIISGGENIASAEIEAVLYEHPDVLEAAVIPVPDATWGEVPKALVVPKPGTTPTAGDLIAFCRERLAGFKVPKSVEFCA